MLRHFSHLHIGRHIDTGFFAQIVFLLLRKVTAIGPRMNSLHISLSLFSLPVSRPSSAASKDQTTFVGSVCRPPPKKNLTRKPARTLSCRALRLLFFRFSKTLAARSSSSSRRGNSTLMRPSKLGSFRDDRCVVSGSLHSGQKCPLVLTLCWMQARQKRCTH